MPWKTLALFVTLFAICCEKCSGQGRPFYGSSHLRTQQIIPEGPAWPASAREYANFNMGNSLRDVSTTSTRKPNSDSQQQTKRRNLNSGRPNKSLKTAQDRRNRFTWKNLPSGVQLSDFGGAERNRPWIVGF